MLESDVTNFCLFDNINCEPGSRFFPILNQFASDNNLVLTDIDMLDNTVTYYSNMTSGEPWVDPAIRSRVVLDSISLVSVLNSYVSSNHKPLSLCLQRVISKVALDSSIKLESTLSTIDRQNIKMCMLPHYQHSVDDSLRKLHMSNCLFFRNTDRCGSCLHKQ